MRTDRKRIPNESDVLVTIIKPTQGTRKEQKKREKQQKTHEQGVPRYVSGIDADTGSHGGEDGRRPGCEGGGTVIPRRVGRSRKSRMTCTSKGYIRYVERKIMKR